MARMLRLSMGLLAVSMLSVLGLHVTSGQEATPTSPYIYLPQTGLNIEGLGDMPSMYFPADKKYGVGVQRLTFEPGVKLELDYLGPVVYYVDQGEMGVTWTKERIQIIGFSGETSTGVGLSVDPGKENILGPGFFVYSESGRLGPTRNAGTGELVVIATLIVPDQGGITWCVTGDPTSTPITEVCSP